MFDNSGTTSPWRRVERLTASGELRDYVEVGACSRCGVGVDRAFPREYRQLDQELICAPCATADHAPDSSTSAIVAQAGTARSAR